MTAKKAKAKKAKSKKAKAAASTRQSGSRRKSAPKTRRALVVLGMHRSGTSAFTRVLNLCGADLPRTLMAPAEDNPAGFWESDRLYQLTEEVLNSAGSSWDDIGNFPDSWFESDVMPEYRRRLAEILADEFEDSSLFVIKDPRFCRLVPLLEGALDDINARADYIIPLRNPLEVAASLKARDDSAPARGMLLWLRHLLDAELSTREAPRMFIAYDDLLTDWRAATRQISEALDIKWPRRAATAEAEIDRFISGSLKHQSAPALDERTDVAERVKAVYRSSLQAARGDPLDTNKMDEARDWLAEADRLYMPIVKDAELVRRNIETESKRLSSELTEARERLASREQELEAQKDARTKAEKRIQTLQQNLEAQKAAREQAEQRIQKLEEDLKAQQTERGRTEQWVESLKQDLEAQKEARSKAEQRIEKAQENLEAQKAAREQAEQHVEKLQQDLEAQTAARRNADQRIDKLEQEAAIATNLLEQVERARDMMWQQLEQVEAERTRLSSEFETLQAWTEERSRELEAQQAVRQQVEEWTKSLTREIEAQKAARLEAEQQLEALRSSTSWRLTAPVRGVGLVARGTGRGLGILLYGIGRLTFRAIPMPERVRWRIRNRIHGPDHAGTVTVHADSVAQPAPIRPEPGTDTADAKAAHRQQYRDALNQFLASGETLSLGTPGQPHVSVVLILYNQAELTFACLQALKTSDRDDMEVVIWDNASTDDTRQLLERIGGARIIRHEENLHFLRGCNQAVSHAGGDHILFLNNDAMVRPETISAALRAFEEEPNVGAVGGRVVLLDGTLQEAGSIVWSDGSCFGYGRGDNPEAPQYMFRRDVDYCSGVFLLTPRKLFNELGGFDEALAPAYYEETDYCMRLWEHGYRTVYEPSALVIHHEFGSSDGENASELMKRNQAIFQEKHAATLQQHHLAPDPENIVKARSRRPGAGRVLYIDDKFPHQDIGQGFPRANFILSALVDKGCEVTAFATNQAMEPWSEIYRDLSERIECFCGSANRDLAHLLGERKTYYDYIYVSRPHNMEGLRYLFGDQPALRDRVRIIYDAEALFCSRDIAKREVEGKPLSDRRREAMIAGEVSLADIADVIVTVSEKEKEHFTGHVSCPVLVIGHAMEVSPGPAGFHERSDFVFVGAMPDDDNPNADSMRWFIGEVWPRVKSHLKDANVKLRVVGFNESPSVHALAREDVEITGRVDDLESVYHHARVIIIPTRYAAGIPYKAHEAAKYGVPMVTSELIAEQLQWRHGEALLAAPADDPEQFAECCLRVYSDEEWWQSIRDHALKRMAEDCGVTKQVRGINRLFGDLRSK